MNKHFLFFFLLLSGIVAQAQRDSVFADKIDREYWLRDSSGSLVVHQSESIAALMDTLRNAELPLEGFRIQLSFGRKEEVNAIRTAFLQDYPDCRAYVSWLQPNFRLRVGDFRTRLQAERFKHKIQDEYPNSYIVRDHIEPPQLD